MLNPANDYRDRIHATRDSSWTSRTRLLLGDDPVDRMQHAHVLVVGMGGVGSYAAEFIARAGVGRMTIVDGDVIEPSNRNRQLPATVETEGKYKVEVMRDRLRDINPDIRLVAVREFITPSRIDRLLAARYDFIVDAIDSLTPKIWLLAGAHTKGMRIVSAMGAGGKLDPTKIRVADISATEKCNLARYVRKRLRRKGVNDGISAVYSIEPVVEESLMFTDGLNFKKSAFGTVSYLPAAFGGACASVVIRGLSADVEVKDALPDGTDGQ